MRYAERRETLERNGYPFTTTTDTEFIAALIHYSKKDTFEDALRDALGGVEGTYSIVALYRDKVFGVRDPSGNRPLVIGEGRGMIVLVSESAACDVLDIRVVRDVAAGEMIVVDPNVNGWYSHRQPATEKFCIFEFVYFLRPDSKFGGKRVILVREEMGRTLWQEHPVEADIVVPIPDSGSAAAAGLAEEARLPLKQLGLFRSHYVGRTFIEPIKERVRALNIKLNPIREIVEGKRIVLVDDSIVRASVIKRVIRQLRGKGAAEIHVRISSPPYIAPCFYGIDTYRVDKELIAQRLGGDVEAIRREIGADTLGYLSIGGLKKAVSGDAAHPGFCDACFTGNYHIPIK